MSNMYRPGYYAPDQHPICCTRCGYEDWDGYGFDDRKDGLCRDCGKKAEAEELREAIADLTGREPVEFQHLCYDEALFYYTGLKLDEQWKGEFGI